jgi:hypothetical protein
LPADDRRGDDPERSRRRPERLSAHRINRRRCVIGSYRVAECGGRRHGNGRSKREDRRSRQPGREEPRAHADHDTDRNRGVDPFAETKSGERHRAEHASHGGERHRNVKQVSRVADGFDHERHDCPGRQVDYHLVDRTNDERP